MHPGHQHLPLILHRIKTHWRCADRFAAGQPQRLAENQVVLGLALHQKSLGQFEEFSGVLKFAQFHRYFFHGTSSTPARKFASRAMTNSQSLNRLR